MKRRSFASLFVVVVAISLILSGCFGGGSGGDSTPYAASGRITDVQGNGVSGVTVLFSGGTSSSTTTDADGKWQASLKGTVRIEPFALGYDFEPQYKTVSDSSSKVNFTMIADGYVVLDEKDVIVEGADVMIKSDVYPNAPKVEVKKGNVQEGTRITYQVLENIPTFSSEGSLKLGANPVQLSLQSSDGMAGLSASNTILTVSSSLPANEDFVGLAVYSGGFWNVLEPTIVGSEWYVELDLDQIYANSEYSSNSITPQMLIFPPFIFTPIVEHDFEQIEAQGAMKVYKFENDDWSSTPVYSTHEGAILSLGKNSFVEDNGEDVLLLVHGIKPGGKYTHFTKMAKHFSENKNMQIYAVEYDSSGGLSRLGMQLAEIISEAAPLGRKIKIVSHSMGGIVSRTALEMYGVADKVSHLVTLGSPHLGIALLASRNIAINIQDDKTRKKMAEDIFQESDGSVSVDDIELELKSSLITHLDLRANSHFLNSLNSLPKPQDTKYFLVAGVDATGYDTTWSKILKPGMRDVNNDGFITEGSALAYSLNIDDKTARYPLNHATIRTDPEVFKAISHWLGLEAPMGGGAISTRAELEAIKYSPTGHFYLVNDIDLAGEWEPIECVDESGMPTQFQGTFDGRGHAIRNLKITNDHYLFSGLFSRAGEWSVIKNVRLEDVYIDIRSDKAVVGSVCGVGSGVIQSCSSTGDISVTASSGHATVGGICGRLYGSVIDCSNMAEVRAISIGDSIGASAGGIAGDSSDGRIEASKNFGYVYAQSQFAKAAGIVSDNHHSGSDVYRCINFGKIKALSDSPNVELAGADASGISYSATVDACANEGDIEAENLSYGSESEQYVIATAGGINARGGNTNNSYNMGNVSAFSKHHDASAGGIIGGSSMHASVSHSHNSGTISVVSRASNPTFWTTAGGICGDFDYGSITYSYNTGQILATSTASSTEVGGICGKAGSRTEISYSYNTGNISVTEAHRSYVGGICGVSRATINDCYNFGDIFASGDGSYNETAGAGGICGHSWGGPNGGPITNCYNSGAVVIDHYQYWPADGICYSPHLSTEYIENCFYSCIQPSVYGTYLSDHQMKDRENFIGFDFLNVWDISPAINRGYPYLLGLPPSY